MTTESFPPPELSMEIERLRKAAPDTQALYREVCALLFFRYGITPTANRLYQLVRKGSMSAPTEALRTFWADLREKSRVRIEHPDLPESLRTAAGEMVASLWEQAQAAAGGQLAVLREEAAEIAGAAEKRRTAAEAESARWQEEAGRVSRQFAEMSERHLELERQLATERSAKESLQEQLDIANRHKELQDLALANARGDFAAELEKQRLALERAEERLQGSEKRALLEIDRERMLSGRLQRELDKLREDLAAASNVHQAQMAGALQRIAELSQQLGLAQGAEASSQARLRQHEALIEIMQAQTKDLEKALALAHREIEVRDGAIESLRQQPAGPLPSNPREARRRKEAALKKKPQPAR